MIPTTRAAAATTTRGRAYAKKAKVASRSRGSS
jgi:hypothetical protein